MGKMKKSKIKVGETVELIYPVESYNDTDREIKKGEFCKCIPNDEKDSLIWFKCEKDGYEFAFENIRDEVDVFFKKTLFNIF